MTEALPAADLDRGELPRVALLQEPPHDDRLPRTRAQVDVQAAKRRMDRSEPAGESELLGGRHAVAARQALAQVALCEAPPWLERREPFAGAQVVAHARGVEPLCDLHQLVVSQQQDEGACGL